MFIVSRSIAGIGGAGVSSGALTIIATITPLRKRALYLGILQSVFGIALITGPVIGGALTQHLSWRWCFYINLPAGGVTLALLVIFFQPPKRNSDDAKLMDKIGRLDLIGATLLAPAVVMLLLATQWGGSTYAWNSATVIGLFSGFGVLLIIFVVWERRKGANAMIPGRLIGHRTILSAAIAASFFMGSYFVIVYFLPEWFQIIKAASPTHSGVMYLGMTLAQIVSSILAGVLVTVFGYYNPFVFVGTSLLAISTGLLSTLTTTTGHRYWIPYEVVAGLGIGLMLAMPLTAAQTVLSAEDIAVGISIISFFQFGGGSIILSIAQALYSNQLRGALDILQSNGALNAGEVERILTAGASSVRMVAPAKVLPEVLQAFNKGITSTFILSASTASAAFCAGLFLEWNSVKRKSMVGGAKK
jgi:predicted MFS family arabinose efflux permease